jgi:hypothetical protein
MGDNDARKILVSATKNEMDGWTEKQKGKEPKIYPRAPKSLLSAEGVQMLKTEQDNSLISYA